MAQHSPVSSGRPVVAVVGDFLGVGLKGGVGRAGAGRGVERQDEGLARRGGVLLLSCHDALLVSSHHLGAAIVFL